MNKTIEVISVRIHNDKVGRLAISLEGLAVFEYDFDWLTNGYSISPFYLPLQNGIFTAKRKPFQGNFGVFADSLPDGWGNLLLDRVLKKYQINPNTLNILTRLSLVGNNGMGALCYEPEQELSHLLPSSDLNFLASEVDKILNEEVESDALELINQQAASSAGARPKVMLKYNNEHWLVKFPSSNDSKNIGEIEYKYSLLAKKAGLEMPETFLFEEKYFGVKRFDRDGDNRIHIHSAAALIYADIRLPALDYIELIKATWVLTRNVVEAEKMFRLMVFNFLIENKDDHAKNFSFIYKKNKWQCSPVYDILPSSGFNGQHSTTIAGQGNPLVKDIFVVAKQSNISAKNAKLIYEEVADVIVSKQWRD